MEGRIRVWAILSLLAAGVGAALPVAAQAGPRADYKQTFSTPVAGASAGTDTQILFKHPDDPDAKPIRRDGLSARKSDRRGRRRHLHDGIPRRRRDLHGDRCLR